MKVAETAIMLGTISARWELARPSSENMTNRGIRVSWEGTIICAR